MKITRAFTLIELLIIMTVIVLMSVISVVAVVNVRNERKVGVVAEQIKNRIMQAHSDALAPQNLGVTEVGLAINGDSTIPRPTTFLTMNEKTNNSNFEICDSTCDQFPSNITFGSNSYVVKFEAANSNTIGQLKSGSSTSIIIKSNGQQATLTINPVTGIVTTIITKL